MALDYGFFGSLFADATLFGVSWLIGLILSFLSVLLVSRNKEDWITLMFPMILGWHISGVSQSFVVFIIVGTAFVISTLTSKGFGTALRPAIDQLQDEPRTSFKIDTDKRAIGFVTKPRPKRKKK